VDVSEVSKFKPNPDPTGRLNTCIVDVQEGSDVAFFAPDYADYVDPVSNSTDVNATAAPPYLSWAKDPYYQALILGNGAREGVGLSSRGVHLVNMVCGWKCTSARKQHACCVCVGVGMGVGVGVRACVCACAHARIILHSWLPVCRRALLRACVRACVCWLVGLAVSVSVSLSVSLSLFVCVPVCPSIRQTMSLCLSVCLFDGPSTRASVRALSAFAMSLSPFAWPVRALAHAGASMCAFAVNRT
jgi:hypothetical protein